MFLKYIVLLALFPGCIRSLYSQSVDMADSLFPVYGMVLNQTTVKEAEERGYACETRDGSSNCDVETMTFWDHDGSGILEYVYMTRSSKMPDKWIEKMGFKWRLSYSEWTSLLSSQGYTIEIIREPGTIEWQDAPCLSAKLQAVSLSKKISLDLDFNYSNSKGYDITSPFTLYSITIELLNNTELVPINPQEAGE